MRFRRHGRARAVNGPALQGLLDSPRFEVLPLVSVLDQTARLPEGTTVTVTASPSRGLDATVELCEKLAAQRLHGVAHLAARQVRDPIHLRDVLDRLAGADVNEVFVVAGDEPVPAGPFTDGLSVLRAMEELGRRPDRVGVPCYPEGHPTIPDDRLWAALADKQSHADYAVSQLCFDAATVCRFVRAARDRGVRLPIHIGLAGAVDPAKLVRIAVQIGVGDSLGFVRKNRSVLARLAGPGRYRPERFLATLADETNTSGCVPAGLHFYTFNRVSATAQWVDDVRARGA